MRLGLVSPAIVLRSRPFGESDKIVSFLTERHGKLNGIAKGALRSRRRFVNSLEPFSVVNLSFQDRPHSSLAFLLSAELVHGPQALLTDLERIAQASYLVEITEGLIGERDESRAVFQHLLAGLRHLELEGASLRFLTVFELKLLHLAGYQPGLDRCKKCQKRGWNDSSEWYVSFTDGGLVCDLCARSCRELLSISRTALEVLAALQKEDESLPPRVSLPGKVVAEVRSAVSRFIQFHLGREVKSVPFLNSLSSS